MDIIGLYENLPEIMVVGERPIVKLEDGKLSYNIPILLERIPADNAFDALKNIPGINVKNENVDFAGQPLTLIIDGKINAMSYQQSSGPIKNDTCRTDRKSRVHAFHTCTLSCAWSFFEYYNQAS